MTEPINEPMTSHIDDDPITAMPTPQVVTEPEWTDELERWVMASST